MRIFKKKITGDICKVTLFGCIHIKYKKKFLCKYNLIYNPNIIPEQGLKYIGNREYGVFNLDVRLKQDIFEYEDMIATNKAIGKYFLTDSIKTIVNIGSGVGAFEYYNAPKFQEKRFVASEYDQSSLQWAKENRSFANVEYCSDSIQTLIEKYGKIDIAVAIDVIEHIEKYKDFLDEFVKLADKAVISTPNRDRYYNSKDLQQPPYDKHVFEWNAGELYFILKMYYKKVTLYSHKDPLNLELVQVGLYSTYDKLIAFCEN